jgi:signal peptidase I
MWAFQQFVIKIYYIPSASMEPTLHSSGDFSDRILVNRLPMAKDSLKSGSIVVFQRPKAWASPATKQAGFNSTLLRGLSSFLGIGPGANDLLVKRIVAIGGQSVSCCDAAGKIVIDNEPLRANVLDYPFVSGVRDCDTSLKSLRCFETFIVPKGEYFVLGDNRPNSNDSFGLCRNRQTIVQNCVRFVPKKDLVGTVMAVVFPFNAIRAVS